MSVASESGAQRCDDTVLSLVMMTVMITRDGLVPRVIAATRRTAAIDITIMGSLRGLESLS